MHKIRGAHLQCVNNHYAKFEYKRNENYLSYRLHKPDTPMHFGRKKYLSSTPVKNKKIFIKCAQNRRCTSSIYEQSWGKVWISWNENCWSYRLHKLGTPKVLQTDGRTDGRTNENTNERTDRRTDGLDPLLDLLSLKRRR